MVLYQFGVNGLNLKLKMAATVRLKVSLLPLCVPVHSTHFVYRELLLWLHCYHPRKPNKICGVLDSSAMQEGVTLIDQLMQDSYLINNLQDVTMLPRREMIVVRVSISWYCKSTSSQFHMYIDNTITQSQFFIVI
jgi:hypothetical protein